MDLRVTGMAKGHQIIFPVIPAFCQRLNVMHLLRLDEPAFSLAPFTKRVCIHVAVTDAFPCPSIPAFGCWIPAVFFVPLVLQLLMLPTILAAFLCEPWTAAPSAPATWFSWHRLTPFGT